MPQPAAPTAPTVQIIVPARNEEASIGRCLESLIGQKGIDFQITVVDDSSADRTREIAESFPGVRVIRATEPSPGISGKCNALIQGADGATAKWLLFTDADTWHASAALEILVRQAEVFGADFFSVSPYQEAATWSEKALLPLIFRDLRRHYRPERVNDPNNPTVAANGQYILVRREIYERLGGHRAVADKILEDVALAKRFKESGYVVWLWDHNTRLVQTRMYRDFKSLVEGWTKNLALLFPHPLVMAIFRAIAFTFYVQFALIFLVGIPISLAHSKHADLGDLIGIWLLYQVLVGRTSWAQFPAQSKFWAVLGLPLYSWLLVRSWLRYRKGGNVTWKGRTYPTPVTGAGADSSNREGSKPEGPHLHGLLDEKG